MGSVGACSTCGSVSRHGRGRCELSSFTHLDHPLVKDSKFLKQYSHGPAIHGDMMPRHQEVRLIAPTTAKQPAPHQLRGTVGVRLSKREE
jgi:hypothetical protein